MPDDDGKKAEGLSDTHFAWIKTFTGIDLGGAAGGAAASVVAPVPLPPPTPVPPPSGPVSGVFTKAADTGLKVAEGVGIGVSVGALAVGVAVGAAILTWSSSTAPPWADETNPETGKPYANEQEYKDVHKRQKQKPAGNRCDGMLKGIFDQLKHLENLYSEATEDRSGLWAKENNVGKFRDRIDPDNQTTWSGHIDQFKREQTNMKTRIAEWEVKCPGMSLTESQIEELEMAREWADKAFPDKPEYAK